MKLYSLNGRKLKTSEYLLYGPTCNLSITKQVAQSIQFNEKYKAAAGEDIDFCFRADQFSFKISFEKEVVIYHDYNYGKNVFRDIASFYTQFSKYATPSM
jgi:GT2 family glycosyltransferase